MPEAFPVGEYVAEELEARGWSTAHAAGLMDGNPAENELWLDLLCCMPLWKKHGHQFSQDEAERLAKLFGTSSVVWTDLYKSYLKAKGADDA